MPVRHPHSKFVSVMEKRLGRNISDEEMMRLAAHARALKLRREQQRIYKPRMELWDDGDSAFVTAVFELPGLNPSDISVDVIDGRLVVSGERRQQPIFRLAKGTPVPSPTSATESAASKTDVCVRASGTPLTPAPPAGVLHVRELKYGFFRRVVSVPADLTTSHLEATVGNGMLTVSWPRDPGRAGIPHTIVEVQDDEGDSNVQYEAGSLPRFAAKNSSRSI